MLSEYYAEADHNALRSAEDANEYAAKILCEKNPMLSITTAVIDGSFKIANIEEAKKYGADLIVVGSHGYGTVERFMLGSVSQGVALHAKCSVEIVQKKEIKRIKPDIIMKIRVFAISSMLSLIELVL